MQPNLASVSPTADLVYKRTSACTGQGCKTGETGAKLSRRTLPRSSFKLVFRAFEWFPWSSTMASSLFTNTKPCAAAQAEGQHRKSRHDSLPPQLKHSDLQRLRVCHSAAAGFRKRPSSRRSGGVKSHRHHTSGWRFVPVKATCLPELDELHRHEQGDRNQVRVQDPESQEEDEPLRHVVGVVALQSEQRLNTLTQSCSTLS